MNTSIASYAMLVGVVVAGGLAALQTQASPTSTPAAAQRVQSATNAQPPSTLPPNHPPIGASSPHDDPSTFAPAPAAETASIVWVPPRTWRVVDNPSAMRLATYRVPHAAGDGEEGELSVTRAGGTTEANIDRWVAQFDGSATESHRETTVQGFKVTVVSVTGSFLGGGMMGGAPSSSSSPRPSWALLGAIVETPGSSYFFKLLGPASTVKAARTSFETMIAAIKRS